MCVFPENLFIGHCFAVEFKFIVFYVSLVFVDVILSNLDLSDPSADVKKIDWTVFNQYRYEERLSLLKWLCC